MTDERRPADLLRERAKVERRLLAAEHAAERDLLAATERLVSAKLKFDRAKERLDRRQERVDIALAALVEAQSARANGPDTLESAAVPDVNEPADDPEVAAPEEQVPVAAVPARDDSGLPPRRSEAVVADDDEPSDPRPTRRRKPRDTTSETETAS